jgi:hypothetical protein
MRRCRKLGALSAVIAFCVVGAANASAAEFTASSTGTTLGHAVEVQSFTFNGGTLKCSVAAAKGAINSTASTERTVEVNYSGCTAFGIATVDVGKAEYTYTAGGTLEVLNNVSITPTVFGTSACTVTITRQSVNTVAFANVGASNVESTPNVSGITYKSSEGACGAPGSNGTFVGSSEFNREATGTVRFDS